MRWFLLLFMIFSLDLFADSIYQIDKGCFNLRDIDSNWPDKNILCELNFGEERKISASLLKQYLPKNEHDKISNINFIMIRRKGVEISEDHLKMLLEDRLRKKFPDYRIEVVKLNSGVKIFAKDKDELVIELPEKGFGALYVTVNNGVKSYKVYSYIRAYTKGYISTDKISKDEDISEKIKLVDVEVSNNDDLYQNDFKAVANQNIPKNRIITKKMLRAMPDKSKGDKVMIVYNNGLIHLESEGILLENAYNNQKVSVKSVLSEKTLYGIFQNGVVVVN
ncbi:MAG: flagella basal body P-ring formation protein FlgA [Calditerrivibrio sp.]|nr:flagella basal body P-ring formation protein FlgA [Calditerrivibrio sp.]